MPVVPQPNGHSRGVLERQTMTAGHDDQLAVGKQLDHSHPERLELPVAVADQHRDAHPQLPEPDPQGLHLTAADPAQYSRERVGAVAALVSSRQPADLAGIVGEQRLGAPALDEILERNTFELVGKAVVGGAALGAFGGVLDPGGGRDEH